MAKPKYRTPEYRAERGRIDQAQARGEWLTCVQGMYGSSGTCVMGTRDIAPDQLADVAHDDSGAVILGPAHRACNRGDGAARGNRTRHAPRIRRRVL